MAGRRSKRMDDTLPLLGNADLSMDDAPDDEMDTVSAPPFAADASADEMLAQANARADQLSLELSAARDALMELKGNAQETPAISWDDVAIIPRVFAPSFNGKLVVNGRAARGLMVLDGTLIVRGPGNSAAARVLAGGYLLLAKGQPYALSTGPERVRAVFVETPDYATHLVPYVESAPHVAVPDPVAASWQDAGATAVHSPMTLPQSFPVAPIAVDAPSKAVMQLTEMQERRGRKSHRVRHPNEPSVPVPAPQTPAQVATNGFHSSGAPLPVQDARSMVSSGDLVVQ